MSRSRCVALLVFGALVALPAAAERMTAQSEPAVPQAAARAAAAVPASWSALPHVRALQSLPAPVAREDLPGDIQKGVVPGPLDGAWFRLKVKAQGFRVNQETGKVGKASFKTTAYMRLSVVEEEGFSGLTFMQYEMWTRQGSGEWGLT